MMWNNCKGPNWHNLAICTVFLLLQVSQSIRIGSFNIQTFGHKKASDNAIMSIISKIVQRYDIIFIQEIRDKLGRVIPDLVNRVNRATNSTYDFVISNHLGHSSYKEQYAYLYRTDRQIRLLSSYNFNDGDEKSGNDTFFREPFIARFFVPCSAVKTMVMAGIHVSPLHAIQEIKSLKDVYDDIKHRYKMDNIIIMGDMNADCSYFPMSSWQQVPLRTKDFLWLIDNDVDTTVKSTNCAYDRRQQLMRIVQDTKSYYSTPVALQNRIIVSGNALKGIYRAGSAKAFHFDREFRLSASQAAAVSDHYPIEFELREHCRQDAA